MEHFIDKIDKVVIKKRLKFLYELIYWNKLIKDTYAKFYEVMLLVKLLLVKNKHAKFSHVFID